jgi:hypothetical protein
MLTEGLKGQSAIEYLMTYGWMLLVVAIVGGAIFSLTQDQQLVESTGFNSDELAVENFGRDSSGNLDMALGNRGPDNIEITEVRVRNSDSEKSELFYSTKEQVNPGSSTVLSMPVTNANRQNEIQVIIEYSMAGLDNLVTRGQINGDIQIDLSDSLSGYWLFDDSYYNGTNFFDVSGNSRSINKNPETPFLQTERGKSLKFNDSLPTMYLPENSFNYDQDSTFAIISWINPTDTSDSNIIGRQKISNPDFPGWKLQLESSGSVSFWMINHTNEGNYLRVDTKMNVSDLEGWNQIAVSYDGSRDASGVKLFVNGSEVSVDVKKNNLSSGFTIAEDTSFGGFDYDVFSYTGYIDSIRVYNSTIGPSRVAERYRLRKQE